MRGALKVGVKGLKEQIKVNKAKETDEDKKVYFDAMDIALDAAVIIANRYADMAEEKAKGLEAKDKERFKLMAATLRKVPENRSRESV